MSLNQLINNENNDSSPGNWSSGWASDTGAGFFKFAAQLQYCRLFSMRRAFFYNKPYFTVCRSAVKVTMITHEVSQVNICLLHYITNTNYREFGGYARRGIFITLLLL